MSETNNIINQHIRSRLIQKLKYVIPITIIFISLVAYSLYNLFSPVTNKEIITGVVQSMHQSQSLTGSDFNHFFVRIDQNYVIKVSISSDRNVPFRKNEKAKIEKITKESGPIIYTFIGYVK